MKNFSAMPCVISGILILTLFFSQEQRSTKGKACLYALSSRLSIFLPFDWQGLKGRQSSMWLGGLLPPHELEKVVISFVRLYYSPHTELQNQMNVRTGMGFSCADLHLVKVTLYNACAYKFIYTHQIKVERQEKLCCSSSYQIATVWCKRGRSLFFREIWWRK